MTKNIKKKEISEENKESAKQISKDEKFDATFAEKTIKKQEAVRKIQLTPQEAYRFFQEEQHKLEHLNEDLERIEQAIFEMDKTIFALKELKDAKEKDVFINLGNNIFVKAKVEDTENFYVNTGTKAVLLQPTAKIISDLEKKKTSAIESANKLHQLQTQTQQNLDQLYRYLTQLQQKERMKKDSA